MQQADFPDRLPDDEIIRRLRSGDEKLVNATMEYLCRAFRKMVAKLLRQAGGDPDQGLEFVLDDALVVFLSQVQNGGYRQEQAALSTFFYGIARNKSSNWVRNRNSQLDHDRQLRRSTSLEFKPVDAVMEEEEKRKRVAAAIQKLDEPCRKLLIEHWWEDKPLKDIAGKTGKSGNATKQHHHRCLKKLRELLKNDLEDWF